MKQQGEKANKTWYITKSTTASQELQLVAQSHAISLGGHVKTVSEHPILREEGQAIYFLASFHFLSVTTQSPPCGPSMPLLIQVVTTDLLVSRQTLKKPKPP